MSVWVTDYKNFVGNRASVVCIGNFDGFHLGHQDVARRCLEEAKRRHSCSILMTFDPHPSRFLRPDKGEPKLLFSAEVRKYIFERLGFDFLLIQKFDRDFSRMEADEFISNVLVKKLKASAVVVGENFKFGYLGKGSPASFGTTESISSVSMPPRRIDNVVISSTQIRSSILAGRIAEANACLGYDFVISGTVEKGDGRGKTLGFPTANIKPETEIIPKVGVYSAVAKLNNLSARAYRAAVNIGIRPTFGGEGVRIEAHLLNFEGDLYGQKVFLFFKNRIRDEKKFVELDELKSQILKDKRDSEKIDLNNDEAFSFLSEFGMISRT